MAIRPYIAIRPYKGKEVDMFWTTLSIGIFIGACIVVVLKGIQIVIREVPRPNCSRARWQRGYSPRGVQNLTPQGKEA